MKFHFNVATEGLRAGHKYISVLGLKLITIEVIPPQPIFDDIRGGGYGVGQEYYTIRITINYSGKKVVKEFKTKILDTTVRFSIKLSSIISNLVSSITASIKENKVLNKLVHSQVKSVQSVEPEIIVKNKDIKIEVKRK